MEFRASRIIAKTDELLTTEFDEGPEGILSHSFPIPWCYRWPSNNVGASFLKIVNTETAYDVISSWVYEHWTPEWHMWQSILWLSFLAIFGSMAKLESIHDR